MKADISDKSFMDKISSLLGFDKDKIKLLLDKLDANSLIALSDAVSNNDKEAVEDVVGSFENRLNTLFKKQEHEEEEEKEEEEKIKPEKPSKDHEFAIGDDVAIKVLDKKTGKKKFISATIFNPNAPNKTIGVKVNGKSKMVDKNNVYTLKEGVIGMVGIPDIQRMQQLAGIQPVETEIVPPVTPSVPPLVSTDEDNLVSKALSALDTLEQILPDMRFSDVKIIRKRMMDISSRMNESRIYNRRKL